MRTMNILTISQMAKRVAESILYCGAYVYPGTSWSHGLQGVRAHSQGPWVEPNYHEIRQILESIPDGEEIVENVRLAGGTTITWYQKRGEEFHVVETLSDPA